MGEEQAREEQFSNSYGLIGDTLRHIVRNWQMHAKLAAFPLALATFLFYLDVPDRLFFGQIDNANLFSEIYYFLEISLITTLYAIPVHRFIVRGDISPFFIPTVTTFLYFLFAIIEQIS